MGRTNDVLILNLMVLIITTFL